MNNSTMFSSDRIDWNTPKEIIEIIRKFDDIGLDPCSNPNSIVGATTEWSLEKGISGLRRPWTEHGLVYCNPPYGRAIAEWSRKIVEEAALGAEIICLLPSRTDTSWMQLMFRFCNVSLFWKGRLTFLGAPSAAPFPSCIMYFGKRDSRFCEIFDQFGQLYRRVQTNVGREE